MARNRNSSEEKKNARFVKEGRGIGRGVDYKPWLTVRDVPSDGRANRVPGWKTGRVHQFLSDIERNFCLLLDWSDSVRDIREQYPLDRKATLKIAEQIGVIHPRNTRTSAPTVMTTDFVVDIERDGRSSMIARAIKPAEALDDRRVVQKLEIERRYWTQRGIDWGLVTERDIPKIVIQNIEIFHSYRSIEKETQPYPGFFTEKAALIANEVPARGRLTLQQFCQEMEEAFEIRADVSLKLVRHLIATKELIYDMSVPFDDTVRMNLFRLAQADGLRTSA